MDGNKTIGPLALRRIGEALRSMCSIPRTLPLRLHELVALLRPARKGDDYRHNAEELMRLAETLLHRYPRRPSPRTEAHQRALVLLRSWLTPEQHEQWAARGDFEVIGSDTGTRYRLTPREVMNVQQLDEEGRPVKQWCFAPEGNLATGDVLLAQKIALETMERKALAIANSQRLLVASEALPGGARSSRGVR